MGVYRSEGGNYYWDEQHLYGSSRTGIWNWNNLLPARPPVADASNPTVTDSLLLGSRNYELSNHLGNVLAVISDKKIGVANTTTPTLVNYYKAEILRQNDYYPFGMQMPGRTFTVGSSYRYGFNGKEKDDEVKNKEGTQLDYGMRIYDTRLGRFLSEDPLRKDYPELTPYQFSGNSPITFTDRDGEEQMFRMPDGSTYVHPPSDHLRVPIPMNVQKNGQPVGGHSVSWGDVAKQYLSLAIGPALVVDGSAGFPVTRTLLKVYTVVQAGNMIGNMHAAGNAKNQEVKKQLEANAKSDAVDLAVGWAIGKASGTMFNSIRAIVSKRIDLANNFYKTAGYVDDVDRSSHLNGIVFEEAVQTTTLKKGTLINQ